MKFRNSFLFLLLSILLSGLPLIFSCRKKNVTSECAAPAIVPFQPYSDPVWHPNGQLLGFNHSPLAGVFQNGTGPCIWYMNTIKPDSTGFYLMNKDGTDFRRVTNFKLSAPSWSPDGNWLAFSLGSNIYKMQFNGITFDTSHLIQLTNSGGNFFPNWTTNSDTIYFDSNNGTSGQGYYVWKMASDSSGKSGIPNTGRQPYIGSDNLIYFVRGASGQPEIFSMNKNGSNVLQLPFNGRNGVRRSPGYYQNKVFFWDGGLFSTATTVYEAKELSKATGESYAISKNGEIVYSNFEFGITDRRCGTLWIMNTDGSNKKQLTFNNY